MPALPQYALNDVAMHKSRDDLWIVIGGKGNSPISVSYIVRSCLSVEYNTAINAEVLLYILFNWSINLTSLYLFGDDCTLS